MVYSSRLFSSILAIALGLAIPNLSFAMEIIPQTQTNSADWRALLEQARKNENDDQYPEAEALYRQILTPPRSRSINDYMFYYIQIRLGTILQTQGKFTEAIAVLQEVIDRAPDQAGIREVRESARLTLARVIREQENSARRLEQGVRAIEQDPLSPRGYPNLVRGLAARGQLVEGATFLETNLGRSLSPEEALRLARAASNAWVSGNTSGPGYPSSGFVRQQAIILFRQLVNRYPDYEPLRTEFLDILSIGGRLEELIAAYREAIQRQPTQGLYSRLAAALERAGQTAAAIQTYEQILGQPSTNPWIYRQFGNFLRRNQQNDRAILLYLQFIQRFPDSSPGDPRCQGVRVTGYDGLVGIFANQNRLDQLLTTVEQSIPNTPAIVYFNLALALKYADRSDQAAIVLARLQQLYPNDELSQEPLEGGCGGSL